MKHGPIALIDSDMPVVVIATHNFMYEKVLSNIQEIKARKGRVIAIVSKGDETISKIADEVIELPETLECLEPLLATIPLQLLAYHVAVCKGKDVDQPRNLAKSVTVEWYFKGIRHFLAIPFFLEFNERWESITPIYKIGIFNLTNIG